VFEARKSEFEFDFVIGQSGGNAAVVPGVNAFGRAGRNDSVMIAEAMRTPLRSQNKPGFRQKLADLDLTPDLGDEIGSLRWFRGLGTLFGLTALSLALLPDFGPLYGAQSPLPTEAEFDEARAQMIMPIAFGGDSGRRMAANENVVSLAASPERPTIELTATLGRGDSFARVLQRAGVGGGEASRIADMVAGTVNVAEITAGTPMEITLGSRSSKTAARPVQSLSFRARFDLNLAVHRNGDALQLVRKPIKVNDTPLRVRGSVGQSLYKSARAAGAPANAIQNYLKIISGRTDLSNLRSTDEFDIIIDYRRAETGETQAGNMLYAGLDRDGKSAIQMLHWKTGENSQWFEASGVGETRGAIGRPVNGPITSGFGSRRHPVLGYRRMHSGLDFGAKFGSPIYAVTDGRITFAGRKGGYGNFVQINHGGNLATGYGHMSRIAARNGQVVRRGQIIGYVGSTGLSTGPHLHYELYRNGHAINPASVKFTSRAQLSGADLVNFRAKLARLKSVTPGAALSSAMKLERAEIGPKREIDRISRRDVIGGPAKG
jgi:murein DD-endopeptidase MepM/ murein hydrolase activator NlpD